MAKEMRQNVISCFTLSLLIVYSQEINQYIEYRDGDGAFIWESTSDFVPVQATSFGEITLGDEMTVKFDFVYHGPEHEDDTEKENFFRVGASSSNGNNCGMYSINIFRE